LTIRHTPHKTGTALPFVQFAIARANIALQATIVQFVPVLRRMAFVCKYRFVHAISPVVYPENLSSIRRLRRFTQIFKQLQMLALSPYGLS
jgi:hypothetical protein